MANMPGVDTPQTVTTIRAGADNKRNNKIDCISFKNIPEIFISDIAEMPRFHFPFCEFEKHCRKFP